MEGSIVQHLKYLEIDKLVSFWKNPTSPYTLPWVKLISAWVNPNLHITLFQNSTELYLYFTMENTKLVFTCKQGRIDVDCAKMDIKCFFNIL